MPPLGRHEAHQVDGVFAKKMVASPGGRCSPASGFLLGVCSVGWRSGLTHPFEGPLTESNLHSGTWPPCFWASLILCHPRSQSCSPPGVRIFLTCHPSQAPYHVTLLRSEIVKGGSENGTHREPASWGEKKELAEVGDKGQA